MEIRRLGRSGLDVTVLGLGTATFGAGAGEDEAREIMDTAYEAGIRLLDTADAYPSLPDLRGETERIVGRWIRDRGNRDQVIVATKVNTPMWQGLNSGGLGRKHILQAADASLARLGLDYVDLLQAHRADLTTPVEETVGAFDALITQGKIRYYGFCNWPAWLVMKACAVADSHGMTRPIAAQYPCNPVMRDLEREVVPVCRGEGIGLLTINALAGGLLSGRYDRDVNEASEASEASEAAGRFFFDGVTAAGNSLGEIYRKRYWSPAHFDAVDRLRAVCAEAGLPMVVAAVAWAKARAEVSSVLLGVSSLRQLTDQLPAAEVSLSPDVTAQLDEMWWDIPRRFVW
jgi:1-deoxyxylulose-5-phosphate synthase